MQDKFINLFTDFGFKKLFGEEANKQLLIDFLNSFLPPYHQIAELSYTKSEQLGRTEEDRKAIYDLACISKGTGERFIVEMQKAKQTFFKDRSIFYSTFPIQEQAQKGDWDYQLSAVYTFGILDFEFDEDKALGHREAVHTMQMKDQNNRVYYDKLTFIYITLPSFTKTEDALVTHQDKWLYAFKHLAMFDDIPTALQESIFLDFFETARVAKLNANDYGNYQESLKNYRDWYAIYRTHEREIEDAEHKGRAEGIEQGIEKVAYNLLDLLDDETIALKTGLSVTQIQKMRQSAPMP
jgi:predicted transposase/invertase (TIGR01784 family)